MRRFRFPIAVAVTSLALVAIAGVFAVLTTPIGALAASFYGKDGVASVPWMGGRSFGPHGFGPQGIEMPPELQGLGDLPPAERFAHFVGVQVNLKDKDNKPFTITVTPGTVTTVSANSLTIVANDGITKTFALNGTTVTHGKPVQGGSQATQQSPTSGDKVIVITANDDQTAKAVIDIGNGDFGPGGFGGPPWAHWGHPGPQR